MCKSCPLPHTLQQCTWGVFFGGSEAFEFAVSRVKTQCSCFCLEWNNEKCFKCLCASTLCNSSVRGFEYLTNAWMQHCLCRTGGGIFDYLFLTVLPFASIIQPHLVTLLLISCRCMLWDANHSYVLGAI